MIHYIVAKRSFRKKKERRETKTKLSHETIPLLLLLLLVTLTLARMPIPASAQATEIEMLTFFAEPSERQYWDQVIPKFQTETGITVKHTAVEFDSLFDEIMRLHLLGQDPDIISVHGMWLPRFASYKDPILTEAVPSAVRADVEANYLPAAVAGATYRGIIYGYPTEVDSHALVYNKTRIPVPPATWEELKTMAKANTQRDGTGAIYVTGFMPYINGNEEKRYEFMNLLWSNNGEFLDLSGELGEWGVPKALFNSTQGVEVLQLFDDLNDNKHPGQGTYDPDILPDIYWQGWVDGRITMATIPTWFNYIRDALGPDFFTELGVAPIPIGPSMVAAGGTYPEDSVCVTFNHMFGVTQRAENEGRAEAAWTFLQWINTPRPAGYIPTSAVGPIPRGSGCSILGDYFIFDGILPSRNGDRLNGLTKEGAHLADDFWFKGFIDMMELYGRPDKPFIKSQEVQDKVGIMFERVASYGEDPRTVADETAAEVNPILPAPGDANMDGTVNVYDGMLVTFDLDARPGDANWNRGRADVVEDNWISGKDGGLIVYNFGRKGGS